MAKIKHNHFLDTVDQVFTYARAKNILHLKAEGDTFDGRFIGVAGRKLYHFGTTGYLGLEQDIRLKDAAKNAIDRYGTQYPLSKSYIAHPLYEELETLLHRIYERPVIVAKNATLAHMAALPVLVGDGDTIILDHQVHWSVQDAANRLKLRGVKIIPVRHNRIDQLESKIQEYGSKSEKIWYLADGVYSMYGDYAPLEALQALARKYKQLHLYFDDVHGMSWAGKYGRGYVYDKLDADIFKRSVLIGTLSKTFGANGSLIICGDEEIHRKIKTFGGSLTFSAQLDPASVGAAIASAKIHLSPEIESMQDELQMKVTFFNRLLKEYKLPVVEFNNSPVFFLATGIPETGYQLTQALLEEGFYVNMGLFPAVPSKNTGLRITLSRHNQLEEIKALADALAKLHPVIMEKTGNTYMRLNKAFKIDFATLKHIINPSEDYIIHQYDSIEQLQENEWDKYFNGEGILDHAGWRFVETVFKNNHRQENNWKFIYFRITDDLDEIILLAAFTISLWKEDILSPPEVSATIEEQRRENPYYLCSPVLSLGSLFSDGQSLYYNSNHPQAPTAFTGLMQRLELIAEAHDVTQIVFRDFAPSDHWGAIFNTHGLIPIEMPQTAIVEYLDWDNEEGYIDSLSTRSRKHFKRDVLPYRNQVTVRIKSQVGDNVLKECYQLYKNVKTRNLGLNVFEYPEKLFEAMNQSPQWEFIILRSVDTSKLLGVLFCYINNNLTYVPSLIGMDYKYNTEFQTYRQLLYESLRRAKELGLNKVDWGISATFEKRKLGATLFPKQAYVHAENNFMMEYLETQRGMRS